MAREIGRICNRSLPARWRDISSRSNRYRRDNYFFRFVLPVAELSGWPFRNSKKLPRYLCAQLLWCFAWRALDDVIDCSQPSSEAVRLVVATYSDALCISLGSTGAELPALMQKISEIYGLSCHIAKKEQAGRLSIAEAWQRSSQFFIVPALLVRLKRSKIEQYRDYINAAALAHDIQDLLKDLRAGNTTQPVRWLRTGDPNFHFRPQLMRFWFRRATRELDQQLSRCRKTVESDSVILHLLLEELADVLADLRGGL